jgi:hypothetical protein
MRSDAWSPRFSCSGKAATRARTSAVHGPETCIRRYHKKIAVVVIQKYPDGRMFQLASITSTASVTSAADVATQF